VFRLLRRAPCVNSEVSASTLILASMVPAGCGAGLDDLAPLDPTAALVTAEDEWSAAPRSHFGRIHRHARTPIRVFTEPGGRLEREGLLTLLRRRP
jgi:hypothetical protein